MNNVINIFQMRPIISIYLHYFSSNLVLKEATCFIPPTQITPLDPSGWTTSIVQADIISAGRADAMLSASHVTRARYAHQITAGSLKILQERAYKQYIDREIEGQNILTFEKWCDQQCQEQPQFKYWVLTLQLELMVLQFI